MELNKLYSIVDKEKISLFDIKIKNKAIISQIDSNYYIGINYRNIGNTVQEKEVIAEELRTLLL